MKIKIVVIGKIKEKIYQSRIQEYIQWISKDLKIEIIILKNSNQENLENKLNKYLKNNYYTICLSEKGLQQTSKQFSNFIFSCNRDIIFFIGGPEGHPKIVQKMTNQILSLSKMTLLHDMSILILFEQIYRAISIKKGNKYHRN